MSTSRRVEAALRDLDAIRRETAWITNHLADLDVIAHSPAHQETEQVITSHQTATESPDLSGRWDPVLRENLRLAYRLLHRHALEITAARVGLERTFGGPGADMSLGGTLLEPGELIEARKAKGRRDTHAGDPRWGEWEATADQQPDPRFRGQAS